MGISDFFKSDQQISEEGRNDGASQAKTESTAEALLHQLADETVKSAIPIPSDLRDKAYESGYHEFADAGPVHTERVPKDTSANWGGGGGGGDWGELFAGGFVWLVISPLYAMFLLFKGILLAIERRSLTPLFQGVSGACAYVGTFSAVFGVIWLICLWISTNFPSEGALRSRALVWEAFFWSITLAAGGIFALTGWLKGKYAAYEGRKALSAAALSSPASVNSPLSSGATLVGWVVAIGFVFTAPQFLALILMALVPTSVNWRLHPLLILPALFIFPFGPAILIGRAVARRVNRG